MVWISARAKSIDSGAGTVGAMHLNRPSTCRIIALVSNEEVVAAECGVVRADLSRLNRGQHLVIALADERDIALLFSFSTFTPFDDLEIQHKDRVDDRDDEQCHQCCER
jgi:hypothetical protein